MVCLNNKPTRFPHLRFSYCQRSRALTCLCQILRDSFQTATSGTSVPLKWWEGRGGTHVCTPFFWTQFRGYLDMERMQQPVLVPQTCQSSVWL